MEVYLGMVLVALSMSLFIKSDDWNDALRLKRGFITKRNLKFLLLVLPCTFVSGLRYYVGTDYEVYLGRYHIIGSVFAGQPRRMEPLFRVLAEIGRFFDSKQLVFFLTAFLFSFFIHRFLVDKSRNIVFSVFLVFFTGTFTQSENIMRQMLGISIALFAMKYIFANDLKKYLFLIIIAAMFHTMSAVYAPLFFLYRIERIFNKKFLLIASAIVFAAGKIFYSLIVKLLILSGSDYVNYFGSSRDTGSSTALTTFSVFVTLFCFATISEKEKLYREKMFMLILMLLACLVLFLGLPNSGRLAYMFIPVQIVLIPNIVMNIKRKLNRQIITIFFGISYVAFWYYFFYRLNIGATFPYQSVLRM